MANWYTTRENVKRAIGATGSDHDLLIDQHIEAASREIDNQLRRRFIPKTQARYYPWPQRTNDADQHIWLDEDLQSVTTLQTANETVTIDSTDYFLEPANTGPPYRRIEIDLGDNVASTAEFTIDDSKQRAVTVTGSWGYSANTLSAGTLRNGTGITAAATSLLCSNGALIGVGDTLLVGTEQIFVSDRTNAAEENNDLLNGALTADQSEVSVTVDTGTRFNAREVILVDSERMLIESISGNVLTVKRAYDGSVLAAHSDDTAVHVFRTLTIERGVNGTTAATHDQTDAMSKYVPPKDIQVLCQAEAIFNYEQDKSGHTGVVGGIDGGVGVRPNALTHLWNKARETYTSPAVIV